MKRRLELHEDLCNVLGTRNVYFQPPESVKMQYPAIVYSLKDIESKFANDVAYIVTPGYEATLIVKEPDSEYVDKLLKLPYSKFDRFFRSDNLNHYRFTLY